ncbi:MAG TPA: hydroxyisourate hydrolase [Steroidobacteraceae bacterium]|nr:hydroxyisourate hydrolase [Steroidobacteraceae bacterium]
MGQLTTHVLDIATGVPAAGVRIDVHEDRVSGEPVPLARAVTSLDGRVAAPLLVGTALRAGHYTLTFHLAEYFRGRGVALPQPAFIERAVIQIGIADPEQHYHVPLLITPWSYSVYRGG